MFAPSCGLWVQSLSALAFASSAAPDCSQLCFSKSVGLRLASSTNAPSRKLEREADKYQEVYRQISAKLAEEITRRPLEAFRVPYEQAKQSSTTLAATRSAERIEKELSAKKADPIGQRIAYITGAAELVRVEKIAKPHEERQQARKCL